MQYAHFTGYTENLPESDHSIRNSTLFLHKISNKRRMMIYSSKNILFLIALFVCTLHADGAKQPEFKPSLNEPKTFRKDAMPEVPAEVVEDIMREYPEIAERVSLLNDETVEGNFVPKTLFLIGRPGCGKTTIALAVAQVLRRKVAFFEGPSLTGNAYQNSGAQFVEARLNTINREIEENIEVKYVVIIEEFMRLAERHIDKYGEGADIEAKLLLIMDKYEESGRVFFIATSDEIKNLSERMRLRFAVDDIIEVKMPSADCRRNMLLYYLKGRYSLEEAALESLVRSMNGLTHRQIENIVERKVAKSGATCASVYEALRKAINKAER